MGRCSEGNSGIKLYSSWKRARAWQRGLSSLLRKRRTEEEVVPTVDVFVHFGVPERLLLLCDSGFTVIVALNVVRYSQDNTSQKKCSLSSNQETEEPEDRETVGEVMQEKEMDGWMDGFMDELERILIFQREASKFDKIESFEDLVETKTDDRCQHLFFFFLYLSFFFHSFSLFFLLLVSYYFYVN